MDDFFTKTVCDRCKGILKAGRTMSWLNNDCICIKCEKLEQQEPDYEEAKRIERKEVLKGNYNFKGIRGK